MHRNNLSQTAARRRQVTAAARRPGLGRGSATLPVLILAWILAWTLSAAVSAGQPPSSDPPNGDTPAAGFRLRTIQGQIVWLAEALAEMRGVQSVPEASQRILALKTGDGELIPLVEDKRGRAFRLDERLRGIPLELLVRQHHGSPMVQVIKVFALESDGKYELDYWCEICSIAMIELKVCDCCQGPIELRRRKIR